MGKQLVSSLLVSADGGGGNSRGEFPPCRHPAQRPRPGRPRGSLLSCLPAAPAQPPVQRQLLGFQGATQPALARGNRGCRWVGPSASRSLRRVFHLEGLWPPHIVGEEADVRGKDGQRNTQRPAAGDATVRQEQGTSGAAPAAPECREEYSVCLASAGHPRCW